MIEKSLAIALALAVALGAAFAAGVRVESNRRDAQLLRAERTAAIETNRLIEINYRAGEANAKTIERERLVTRTIKELVNVYLPAPDPQCPVLPAAWRVLHDSAASGVDPAAQPGTDVPGPSPQVAAATVAENYGAARITAERLAACQHYIRTVVRPQGLQTGEPHEQ